MTKVEVSAKTRKEAQARLKKMFSEAIQEGLIDTQKAQEKTNEALAKFDERLAAQEKKQRRGFVAGSEDETYEGQEFSVARVANSILDNDRSLAPMEWEMHDAARAELNDGGEKYAQDTTVGTKGGFIVPTAVWHDKFIEKLRPLLVTEQLGANTMDSGGVSVVEIPIEVDIPTVEAVAENAPPLTTSEVSFQMLRLEGHAAISYLEASRKFFDLGVNAESNIRNRMLREIGIKWNTWALKGLGSNGEPRGLLNSIPAGNIVDFANAIDGSDRPVSDLYERLLEMEEKVAEAEALDGAISPGWAAGIKAIRALRTIHSDDPGGSAPVLEFQRKVFTDSDKKLIIGYPYARTSLLDSGATTDFIFGDFNWLTIVTFGNLTIDMSTESGDLFKKRQVALLATMEIDVAVEQPTAFAAAENFDTSGI